MKQTFSKIVFKQHQIWVGKDADGAIALINLNNLCKILLRKDMIDNGQAISICSSSCRYPLYSNGKLFWFIDIYDTYVLLRKVRKENGMIAKVCDELSQWLDTITQKRLEPLTGTQKDTAKPLNENINIQDMQIINNDLHTEMVKGPVIFNFNNQPVSFKLEDKNTYVNATELSRIYAKKPREWLLLSQTLNLRQSLVEQKRYKNLASQVLTTRGSNGVTWIEEHLALEFTKWLSPQIHSWYVYIIKQWGTKGYVTLNKQGVKEGLKQSSQVEQEQSFPVPKTFSEALILAGRLQKLVELKDRKIEEDKPKVDFYNDFIENREWFRTAIIADELRISTVSLNRFLYENKICRYDVKYKQWVCIGAFANLQIPVPYLWTNKKGKTYSFGKVMRWTPAGREHVLEIYRQQNSQKLLQQ